MQAGQSLEHDSGLVDKGIDGTEPLDDGSASATFATALGQS
jgi:hypothetical protein